MWLYVPGTSCPSAPDTAASNSRSDWRFRALARSVWWRGKHFSAVIWKRRWNKHSWLKRLCTRMLKPSMAARGVAKWIASLEDTRASRSLSPGDVLGPPTHVTSGQLFAESLMRSAPPTASLRTSMTTSGWASTKLSKTWKQWITSLRREFSHRLKRGQAMYGNGSTSWRSPQSANGTQGPKSPELLARCEATGQSEITLTDQAASWTPPKNWATPKSRDFRWGTPKASDGEKPSAGKRAGQDLTHQAQKWGTPTGADDTGTRKKVYSQGGSALSLQAETMMLDGVALLNFIQNSRPNCPWRLNPAFQEWLMRLPIGWLTASIASEQSETALTLWSRRWRSRLFTSGSEADNE